MIRTSFFTFLLVCLLSSVCMSTSHASQTLDANEQAIVAWSEAHVEDAVDLLERLVNINSGTLNQQGVKDVGVVLREELDGLGFQTRWIGMPQEMQRAGHLFGKLDGSRGKKILLIGDLSIAFLIKS